MSNSRSISNHSTTAPWTFRFEMRDGTKVNVIAFLDPLKGRLSGIQRGIKLLKRYSDGKENYTEKDVKSVYLEEPIILGRED